MIGRERIIVRNFDEAEAVGTGHDILQAIGYAGPLQEIEQQRVDTSLRRPSWLMRMIVWRKRTLAIPAGGGIFCASVARNSHFPRGCGGNDSTRSTGFASTLG